MLNTYFILYAVSLAVSSRTTLIVPYFLKLAHAPTHTYGDRTTSMCLYTTYIYLWPSYFLLFWGEEAF
jgi:hypothetical protein